MTSAFIKGIRAPASGSIEYWDVATPGLCLRSFATGRATWSFRYRAKGGKRYERLTIGPLADFTLAQARERALKKRVEVHDGGDPQGDRRRSRAAAANALTFDALATRYINEYAKPNKASWAKDEGYLNRPRRKWGLRTAASVTRPDAIALLDEIAKDAPISANRTQTVLAKLFGWAADLELVPVNPVAGLAKRAKEKPKERTLSDPELKVIWAALEARGGGLVTDVADALLFLLLSGQRPGEVAGMTTGELADLGKPMSARWEIPSARMKARRPHVVPLAPMALGIIEGALTRREKDGDGNSVFASRFYNRDVIARHSLSHGLKRLIAKLPTDGDDAKVVRGLQEKPPTPHDFRRTVGTGVSRLGIPREDRRALLAHVESDVMGAVYDKYERLHEKRVALLAWERHVAEVIGRAPAQANVTPMKRRRP